MSTQRALWIVSAITFMFLLYLIGTFAQINEQIHGFSILKKNTNLAVPKYHFVLVTQQYDNPYYRSIEKGARIAADREHVDIEYAGPLRSDPAEQMKLIDKAINSDVDGIITQGLSGKEFAALMEKAANTGIQVVTVDTDAPGSKRLSYVGTDNYSAGKLIGNQLAATIKESGNIAIITGSNDESQKERVQGILDAVKLYKNIHVAAIRLSQFSRIQAAAEVQTILNQTKNLTAIVGTSAYDGLGIYDALRNNKNTTCKIFGFDDLPDTIDLLRKGKITAIAVQEPKLMGEIAVEQLVAKIHGKVPPKVTQLESYVITADSLKFLGDFK
ncbi:substrate-binding domain-containing protein [Fodinisporobacter ferrooxydans]|uniref:Substrate-binding domain-containing protein n=1 Tax=Fodinisporobacter ferrooxydans TaxID=2901836 RepID=A0ABY4CKF4_9BACL|nr:substrate-binding domain-containing protein [Alicyclobacillaceae bacterium MYW30-H2]